MDLGEARHEEGSPPESDTWDRPIDNTIVRVRARGLVQKSAVEEVLSDRARKTGLSAEDLVVEGDALGKAFTANLAGTGGATERRVAKLLWLVGPLCAVVANKRSFTFGVTKTASRSRLGRRRGGCATPCRRRCQTRSGSWINALVAFRQDGRLLLALLCRRGARRRLIGARRAWLVERSLVEAAVLEAAPPLGNYEFFV